MTLWQALKLEAPPMLRLAAPVVVAELGWVAMSIVDTLIVGRVNAAAIGAVSVGGIVFYTIALFGVGILLGLDTLVSQSFGAGEIADCHRSLINGLWLSAPLSVALMGIVWAMEPLLAGFGVDADVLKQTIPYLDALVWSTFPLLVYFAFRRYLQAINIVTPVMFALITANLLNLAGNWIFVFGHFGAPALGARGSGWSTCIARVYLSAVLIGYTWFRDRNGLWKAPWKPDPKRIQELFRIGLPAALQIVFEVGVFAMAAALIGRLGATPLAAHQIAINAASLSYMVPFGIGSAAAVRVGQALGRKDPVAARRSGWTAMLFGVLAMSLAGLIYMLFRKQIIRLHSPDLNVLNVGVTLFAIVAAFQLFDGMQSVATGALRGAGDTRTPMFCHLLGYWAVGLPAGYYLCFQRGWGAAGMWTGLCIAIITIGSVLLLAWRRSSSAFSAPLREPLKS